MYIDAILNIVLNLILFGLVVVINYKIKCRYWIRFDKKGIRLFSVGVILSVIFFSLLGFWIYLDKTCYLKINTSDFLNNILILILLGLGYLGVAFFEETLFRGIILYKLNSKISISMTIIIQAIIFSSFHFFNYRDEDKFWIKILTAFIIAIVLSIVTIITQSLMTAIGAHSALDLCSKLLVSDDKNKFNWLIHFEQNKTISSYGHIIIGTDYKLLILLTMALLLVIVFMRNYIKSKSNEIVEV